MQHDAFGIDQLPSLRDLGVAVGGGDSRFHEDGFEDGDAAKRDVVLQPQDGLAFEYRRDVDEGEEVDKGGVGPDEAPRSAERHEWQGVFGSPAG